jgi:hypothetical protein
MAIAADWLSPGKDWDSRVGIQCGIVDLGQSDWALAI